MNEQGVLIAIVIVVAVVIAWPLVRGRMSNRGRSAAPAAEATPASEELAELELDRSMGRVSDEDYARFRRELEVRAPAPMESSTVTADAASRTVEDAATRAEALVRQWKAAPRPTCPTCGLRPEPQARYCSNCGAALAPDA